MGRRMEQSFFKKRDPRVAVGLADGRRILFHDIGHINGQHLGLLSTHEEPMKNSLRALVQQNKGGIDEISYEEYMELKKNRNSSPPPFREEIKNSDIQRQRASLAAEKERAEPVAQDKTPEPPVAPPPSAEDDRPKPRAKGAEEAPVKQKRKTAKKQSKAPPPPPPPPSA